MTPEQCVDVLTTAAAFDQRTIGSGDVGAWYSILEPFEANVCIDAVIDHYRTEIRRIMPADVRRLVIAIRQDNAMRQLPAVVNSPNAYSRVADLLAGRKEEAAAVSQRNKALILAHSDLAERLTRPPIGYARPQQWNGFVPPEIWNQQHNDSPRRAALVELIAEAERRGDA